MKPCRSCQKEIADTASKCPYCQSFQTKWKNPQLYGLLFFIPVIAFSTFSMLRLKGEQFTDHKDQISITEINRTATRLIFEINNKTDVRWTNPNIEIIFTDKAGRVVGVKTDSSYSTIVPPNAKTLVEVQVDTPKECDNLKSTLKSMDNRPY